MRRQKRTELKMTFGEFCDIRDTRLYRSRVDCSASAEKNDLCHRRYCFWCRVKTTLAASITASNDTGPLRLFRSISKFRANGEKRALEGDGAYKEGALRDQKTIAEKGFAHFSMCILLP